MHKSGTIISLAALLLLAFEAIGAPPPVEAFGKIPQVDNVALSPDGKLVAWEDNRGDRQTVVVWSLEAGKLKTRFGTDPDTKVRSLRWADDTTLLIDVSKTLTYRLLRLRTNEWSRILAADVTTGKTSILLMNDGNRRLVTGANLLAARTGKPGTVTMASWDFLKTKEGKAIGTRLVGGRDDSGWVYSAFSVDTRSGRGSAIAHGSQFTNDWVVDASGAAIARSDWRPEEHEYSIFAKDGLAWRKIHAQKDTGELWLVGLSSDEHAVLAVGANGHKTNKLWSIPLDGSGAQVLVEDPERDVVGVIRDPLTGAALAVDFGGVSVETHWLDKKAQARQKSLSRAFPGLDVWIVGRSENDQRVVAQVEGPSHPTIYYLVDFGTGKADIIGEAYPGLVDAKLGEVRAINYSARDGTSIPAYLTLPPGAGEKNLPLVVLPHGGPESRDYFEFDWWAQFLASRGYAVLQPQFRGSTGFGEAHRLAGYRQWGGRMQDDVTDGVKVLVEQGLADPRRICIAGASYGGYAALAGAAFTPGLYACAASVNGVSDLPAFIGFKERDNNEESDAALYWRDHIGDKLDAKVAEKSPARAAASITAPVLLIHGVDDTVVPIAQSEKMERVLMEMHRPVKFVKLPGEDHWLSRSETRIQVLAELESFLGAHLAEPAAQAGTK